DGRRRPAVSRIPGDRRRRRGPTARWLATRRAPRRARVAARRRPVERHGTGGARALGAAVDQEPPRALRGCPAGRAGGGRAGHGDRARALKRVWALAGALLTLAGVARADVVWVRFADHGDLEHAPAL